MVEPRQIENSASLFKSEPIEVTINNENYSLVYDMNAFIELEKIYGTVDNVIKKVLGKAKKEHVIKVDGVVTGADKVTVDDTPLSTFIATNETSDATTTDTINILYCGMMRDLAIYDEHDEIVGYKVSKRKIAAGITFKNLREVNMKLAMAFIQDLMPTAGETKNEPGAEAAKAKGLHYSE